MNRIAIKEANTMHCKIDWCSGTLKEMGNNHTYTFCMDCGHLYRETDNFSEFVLVDDNEWEITRKMEVYA